MTSPHEDASPIRLEITWSEEANVFEVTVHRHGRRVGVTQARHLGDLGQTVHDYIAIAETHKPITPNSDLEKSLLPKEHEIREVQPFVDHAAVTLAVIRELISEGHVTVPPAAPRENEIVVPVEEPLAIGERVAVIGDHGWMPGTLRTIVGGAPHTTWYVHLDGENENTTMPVPYRAWIHRLSKA